MSDEREPSEGEPDEESDEADDGGALDGVEDEPPDTAHQDLSEPLAPGQTDLSEDAEFEREGPGLVGTAELAPEHLKGALEALILVSDKPVQAIRLARLTSQDVGTVRKALAEIAADYQGRGIALDEIAGGFQFRTSPKYAPFVRMLVQQKPTKLSRAQLEALSIIAYRQPVTRPEIDDVRGVDSGSALKLLLERNLIKIIGKKEEAGRPLLYGTTTDFLELFGLKNLRDLPTLREFSELTQESRDIFERRIGEPLPGQGQGMDLETHYEAPPQDVLDAQARADELAEEQAEQPDEEVAGEGRADDGADGSSTDSASDDDGRRAAAAYELDEREDEEADEDGPLGADADSADRSPSDDGDE